MTNRHYSSRTTDRWHYGIFLRGSEAQCLASDKESETEEMDPLASETIYEVWHIFCTILPTLFCIAFARIATTTIPWLFISSRYSNMIRYFMEFSIIIVPVVISVNVANAFVLYFNLICIVVILILMHRKQWLIKARERYYEATRRPIMFTLARTTINVLTAICILAIDFNSFPRVFRKSRTYGASLMDVGIGLFIVSMGIVSRRMHRMGDIFRLLRVVAPILLLGLTRTVVIMAIDYHQDEHEYGVHLNAFFTLGFTKLFGTLLSAIATNDKQLVYLGAGVLCLHEVILQLGVTSFVLDSSVERDNLWNANREGICSLPGYIGIFLISIYVGRVLGFEYKLTFEQMRKRLLSMLALCGLLWILTILSIIFVHISRVTCNFGYAIWILAIAVTMCAAFNIVFDFILDTIYPVTAHDNPYEGDYPMTKMELNGYNGTPSLVEAINMNGLVFFLIANVLTGAVNIFLKPENRSDLESVAILTIYMLIATIFVLILQRLNIRIA